MHVEAREEHRWLQRLVGEWTFELDAAEPGRPPERHTGTERVRALGDVWILCEGEGDGPDAGTSRSLMTLGYDPARGRFVGSFVASMMTHFWLYDGALDASGRALVLDAEGPSFTGGDGTLRYRDTIELVSDDHRILRSEVLGDDGAWTAFMTAHYRRRG